MAAVFFLMSSAILQRQTASCEAGQMLYLALAVL
jgi:hypothetical protein